MPHSAFDRKLLVIGIDGLSQLDLEHLSGIVDWAKDLHDCLRLVSAAGQTVPSLQSAWAEILTGLPWYEADCPGYRRPAFSLNECEVMMEGKLSSPMSLLEGHGEGACLVVNMPLIQPRSSSRVWLADGSLPTQLTVDPPALALDPPLNSYIARPFPSTAKALLNLSDSVNACIHNENIRLECALKLLEKTNWRVCFLRITIFDLLHHLLGQDYLHNKQLSVWPAIRDFLRQFDKTMQRIACLRPAVYTCVVSTFCHTPCHARLNVNQMLSELGFCQFKEQSREAELVLARRREASLLVTWQREKRDNLVHPSVSLTHSFELSRTLAASPISGTVYLNRSSRFSDGIVSDEDADSIRGELEETLKFMLKREFGALSQVTTPGGSTKINATAVRQPAVSRKTFNGHLPELTLSVAGVELHNSRQAPTVDHENHPRSTHDYRGFAWLSGTVPLATDEISTVALHQHLLERLL